MQAISETHPLEPMTSDEVTNAVEIVRRERNLSESVRFVSVTLNEPSPEVVRGDWLSHSSLPLAFTSTAFSGIFARMAVWKWTSSLPGS